MTRILGFGKIGGLEVSHSNKPIQACILLALITIFQSLRQSKKDGTISLLGKLYMGNH